MLTAAGFAILIFATLLWHFGFVLTLAALGLLSALLISAAIVATRFLIGMLCEPQDTGYP